MINWRKVCISLGQMEGSGRGGGRTKDAVEDRIFGHFPTLPKSSGHVLGEQEFGGGRRGSAWLEEMRDANGLAEEKLRVVKKLERKSGKGKLCWKRKL